MILWDQNRSGRKSFARQWWILVMLRTTARIPAPAERSMTVKPEQGTWFMLVFPLCLGTVGIPRTEP